MASTYLQRTLTAGNRKTWTLSFWIKPAKNTSEECLFSDDDGSDFLLVRFNSSRFFEVREYTGSEQIRFITDGQYYDCSAWYHVCIKCDTTQTTEADRFKIFLNGSQLTTFSTSTYPSLNYDTRLGYTGTITRIGADDGAANKYNGYIAQFVYADGTAYDPTTFGSFDATSGQWSPKGDGSIRSGVTFGTNGCLLSFENASYLGYDYQTSARSTTNDYSVTGEGMQTQTNPSNTFCSLNPVVDYGSGIDVFYDSNLMFYGAQGNAWRMVLGSLPVYKGKWYFETKIQSASSGGYYRIGFASTQNLSQSALTGSNAGPGTDGPLFVLVNSDAKIYSSTNSSNGTQSAADWFTFAPGDIVCCALDLDNGFAYYRKDAAAWANSADPTSGATGTGGFTVPNFSETYFWTPCFLSHENSAGSTWMATNFGEGYFANVSGAPTTITSEGTNASGYGKFEYDVPTGYTAICTKGLNL